MGKIDKVVLGFENCEYVEIPGEHVLGIELSGNRGRVIRSSGPGYVLEYRTIEKFAIKISKEADRTHREFGCDNGNEQTLFERLSYGDIALVELFADGIEHETLYVEYDQTSGWKNRLQFSHVDINGNLDISVNARELIGEYNSKIFK